MSDPILASVATGVLVDVISTTGRWIATELSVAKGQKNRDLNIATWFDTYTLSDSLPALPNLPAGIQEEHLRRMLRGDDVQAIIHELLAVRLSDAPETEADRLREVFQQLLGARLPELSPIAGNLFDFFDNAICDLTARLSTSRPEVLRGIREEAHLTRINATLSAIERHAASFAKHGFQPTDQDFLIRYRRQIADYHGKIEPPDLQQRRRVAIDDLYVSPTIMRRHGSGTSSEISLEGLDNEIDRTVLLGEPGGGKTTACHVLAYRHATESKWRTPFFVTLREFAADDPPSHSVVGYIEHKLETFYQCPAPVGLVERVFLSGAALVIFDGLDELIDTGHRMVVTAIVERFCMEYPLIRVLVTSRLIGYDQARLDDTQFVRHQITGFDDERVGEYVSKWFEQDPEFTPEESERYVDDFMSESAAVNDLRSNPLMLALMCILYRGEGSIPRNRPEVYEQCSTLLFRQWDARRRIHVDLRARNLVEPALRHLAYWLFTRESPEPAVTESDLIAETAQYFQEFGFEQPHDAEAAAREFVEFCRGRAWVFSDAGTTARGEELYTFTHRTFLEYFAAVQLASICDTPERLAKKLVTRIARQEWEVVAELALQVKDHTAHRGADRFYAVLLGERRRRSDDARQNIVSFLCRCLAFVSISAAQLRALTRKAMSVALLPVEGGQKRYYPLALLVENCIDQAQVAGDELTAEIARSMADPDDEVRYTALRIAVYLNELPIITDSRMFRVSSYWKDLAKANRSRYAHEIATAAESDAGFAVYLLARQEMGVSQFLAKHGPVEVLFGGIPIFNGYRSSSYSNNPVAFRILVGSWEPFEPDVKANWIRKQLDAIADILASRQQELSIDGPSAGGRRFQGQFSAIKLDVMGLLSERQRTAAGWLIFVFAELSKDSQNLVEIAGDSYLAEFLPYIEARAGAISLPSALEVLDTYQELFLAWARKDIDLVRWDKRLSFVRGSLSVLLRPGVRLAHAIRCPERLTNNTSDGPPRGLP